MMTSIKLCSYCQEEFIPLSINRLYCHKCKNSGKHTRTVDAVNRYREVKNNAERRNISFELTRQEFVEFYRLPCVYCSNLTSTVNLDRVDNSIGYVLGNVVPCCSDCNMMKGTKSLDEWIIKLKRIVDGFT